MEQINHSKINIFNFWHFLSKTVTMAKVFVFRECKYAKMITRSNLNKMHICELWCFCSEALFQWRQKEQTKFICFSFFAWWSNAHSLLCYLEWSPVWPRQGLESFSTKLTLQLGNVSSVPKAFINFDKTETELLRSNSLHLKRKTNFEEKKSR